MTFLGVLSDLFRGKWPPFRWSKGHWEEAGWWTNLAAHRSRVIIGGYPTHFPYEGIFHPITLDLCAAKKSKPFEDVDLLLINHQKEKQQHRPMAQQFLGQHVGFCGGVANCPVAQLRHRTCFSWSAFPEGSHRAKGPWGIPSIKAHS